MAPRIPRRSLAALFVALLVLPACQGYENEATQKAKDDAARTETWMTSALTYYDGGSYEQAERMFRRVLEVEPQNKKAQRGLAGALLNQGTPEKLRQAEVLLLDLKKMDWTHETLGDRRFELLTDLARVYSELADYYERDIHGLEEALARDPDADAALLRSRLQQQIEARNQLLHRAIPLYREVLDRNRQAQIQGGASQDKNTDNPYALAGLAKAHLQLGNDDLGIHFSERYIALSRESQLGWKRQLDFWEKNAGRPISERERAEYIGRIQGAREKEKKTHLMLASVYMRREEFDKAIAAYDVVIDMDPTVPAAYVERAQAHAGLADYSSAIRDLEEYLKMTDPQRHRSARASAVDLLERYRAIEARVAQAPRPRAADPLAPAAPPGLPGSPDR
jgi:tetratricopeptide (TPR) repeat protein